MQIQQLRANSHGSAHISGNLAMSSAENPEAHVHNDEVSETPAASVVSNCLSKERTLFKCCCLTSTSNRAQCPFVAPELLNGASMPSLTFEEFAARYPQSDSVGHASGVNELGRGGASSGVERYATLNTSHLCSPEVDAIHATSHSPSTGVPGLMEACLPSSG